MTEPTAGAELNPRPWEGVDYPFGHPPVNPGTHWKRPDVSPRGDTTADAVHIAIGRALTSWEVADGAIASLFGLFMSSSYHAASRVFGTLISTGARRAALEAAAEVFFEQQRPTAFLAPKLSLLLNHYGEAAARRSEIAHAMVVGVQAGDGIPAEAIRGYYLMPSSHNSKKNVTLFEGFRQPAAPGLFTAKYAFTSADIVHFAEQFSALHWWVGGYMIELNRARGV